MSLGSIRNAFEVYKKHDFSRSNQFRLISIVGAPDYVNREINERPAGEGGALYIQSATIPGKTIVDMEIPYHGFNFHAPSTVRYEDNPWSVTFRTPGDYLVRNALEAWQNEIVSDETSCGVFKIPCMNTKIRIGLTASDSCRIIRVYDLIGVYPTKIGPIQYDLTQATMTTFEASFYYQYWRLVPNFDDGLLEFGTPEQLEQISTYNSYHSEITESKENC